MNRTTIACTLVGLSTALLLVLPLTAEDRETDAHAHHRDHAVRDAGMGSEFRILRVFDAPPGFVGNLAFDAESKRLLLLSFGPPANTKGPSRLYELDPEDGRVLRTAQMPFLGELGTPVFSGGHLYQVVDHQSELHKISVAPESFGEIVETVELPGLNDIEVEENDPLRFPFIAFRGLTATPEGQLVAHAQDIGEFFTLDPATGEPVSRVPTLRALGGIAAAQDPNGKLLILANSDPVKATFDYHVRHYMFRADHGMVPMVRHGKKAVHWVLLDGASGEILASLRRLDPRAEGASVALIDHREVPGTPYGQFEFFATGEDGVFVLEWAPGRKS